MLVPLRLHETRLLLNFYHQVQQAGLLGGAAQIFVVQGMLTRTWFRGGAVEQASTNESGGRGKPDT